MKKLTVVIVVMLGGFVGNTVLIAQFFSTEKLGVGFNIGAQKIYCDIPHTGFALGMEGYGTYRFSNYVSAIAGIGYGELSDGTFHLDKSTFTTRMLTMDMKAALHPSSNFPLKPMVYIGAGLIQFSNDASDGRRLVGSYLAGGALEWRFKPQLGLLSSIDYRYADTDNLDSGRDNQVNDGYLNIRTGITYYFNAQKESGKKVIAKGDDLMELVNSEEAADEEINDLLEGIDNYKESATGEGQMDDYIRLKSRVDELQDHITQKELEIEDLRAQLTSRESHIQELEHTGKIKSAGFSAPAQLSREDFSENYKTALEKYYAHDYDAAIDMFNSMLEAFPNHRLVSNCQYWIGESYFGKRQYKNAIEAFEQVLNYAKSSKQDDALIMMGRCSMKLGQTENAKRFFNRLMSEYPESEFFDAAEKYLNSI